jgi:hypothetical protein
VNTLLIQQALSMLMQNNANLFAISVVATQKVIQFPVTPRIKKHLLSRDDWDFIVIENGINLGLTPTLQDVNDALESLDELGEWTYPGDSEFNDYSKPLEIQVPLLNAT